jgi:hypothetical protein
VQCDSVAAYAIAVIKIIFCGDIPSNGDDTGRHSGSEDWKGGDDYTRSRQAEDEGIVAEKE